MIVVDASCVLDALLGTPGAPAVEVHIARLGRTTGHHTTIHTL